MYILIFFLVWPFDLDLVTWPLLLCLGHYSEMVIAFPDVIWWLVNIWTGEYLSDLTFWPRLTITNSIYGISSQQFLQNHRPFPGLNNEWFLIAAVYYCTLNQILSLLLFLLQFQETEDDSIERFEYLDKVWSGQHGGFKVTILGLRWDIL